MDKRLLEPRLPLHLKQKISIIAVACLFGLVPFIPWTAFTVGTGQVTAIDPNERVQTITAPVSGFVSAWLVGEGQAVKKGDVLARLQDNDPSLLERMERERAAAESALSSAQLMLETSKLNLTRQKALFDQGLSARKEYEKAKIETSKMSMEYAKAQATLTKAETQYSRQLQTIIAPRDGVITRIMPGERGQLIKAGTPIAVLTPEMTTPAVEIWIDGNDTAFLSRGQEAQIQFEGWPSLQIPGWPSIAIGTFKAKVHLVDAASSYQGKFRVLLTPVGNWPESPFLRPGAHAKGYISLSQSFILKEAWRQLTGLPPVLEPINDEIKKLLENQKEQKTDEEEKK
jgi:RND family efflux transporter MFP subunit